MTSQVKSQTVDFDDFRRSDSSSSEQYLNQPSLEQDPIQIKRRKIQTISHLDRK